MKQRVTLMAVSNDNYVDFDVQYGGNTERRRVTGTALLNRERASRTNTNHGDADRHIRQVSGRDRMSRTCEAAAFWSHGPRHIDHD